MRLLLVIVLNLFFLSKIAAQHEIDSLKRLLTGKEDTTQIWLLKDIAESYYSHNNKDSVYIYLQKSLQLSEQLNFTKGEMEFKRTIAEMLFRSGNYPGALKLSLESVKKSEQLKDTENLYWSLRNAMMTYEYLQGEEKQVINYANRIKSLVNSGFFKDPQDKELKELIGYTHHAAYYYEKIGKSDSVLYFRQRSYEASLHLNDPQMIAITVGGLASIHEKMGNQELAFTYYKMNIDYAKKAGRYDVLSNTELALARIFQEKRQLDSAFYYTYQSLFDMKKSQDPSSLVDIYTTLSDLYKETNKYDSSFKYLQLKVNLKDSLFSQEKLKDIQDQSFAETVRQQEIATAKEKEKKERRQNLQMIAIGVFVITFFTFVLFLSRSKRNARPISFLTVLALLMVFEFIAMLAHPYIEEWTHHNPVLMLLILVAIASILVPLHHRIEHWIKKRSVTKHTTPMTAEQNYRM